MIDLAQILREWDGAQLTPETPDFPALPVVSRRPETLKRLITLTIPVFPAFPAP
jgi:hypothetical protein